MKFPSLSRLPRYKRFNFEPRFYDPVKERIEKREKEILKEMAREVDKGNPAHYDSGGLRNSFQRRQSSQMKTSTMQLVLVLILFGCFFGYLYFGEVALYALIIILPIYILVRTRKFFDH